ncbi:hypothetical protein Q4485_12140 [Granulosicoccaceae sp. 1_MG-2023]|nr:hypothetical protein [Granulosicoccaceae sp. 1_MG-2023]
MSEYTDNNYTSVTPKQTAIAILWPSFLLASVANVVFWAFVDPHEFGRITGYSEIDRMTAYSVGFIVLWFFTGFSSYLTLRFNRPRSDVNP